MSATTLPPNLLYLAIYNPTLRPSSQCTTGDDEDAEEQAHILFYTSRERAASRDKMLRQVGLAKALVNFSELFSPEEAFDNAHSQTKRLVTISPEPDFWINAGVELARTPRAPDDKAKAKSKDKPRGNGAEKTQDKGKGGTSGTEAVYDHLEGSVHDLALKADLFRAYETFKLTHGSFSSILSSLGQQALELQLERFFTPWAWTWNLEDGHDFGAHLGVPLHPLFHSVVRILDAWSSTYTPETATMVLAPPHVLPSTQYMKSNYPAPLPRHLLSVLPPRSAPTPSTPKATRKAPIPVFDAPPEQSNGDASKVGNDPLTQSKDKLGGTFLGMPAMNVNMQVMDVRKWGWPGYMTFGKAAAKRSDMGPKEPQEPIRDVEPGDLARDEVESGGRLDSAAGGTEGEPTLEENAKDKPSSDEITSDIDTKAAAPIDDSRAVETLPASLRNNEATPEGETAVEESPVVEQNQAPSSLRLDMQSDAADHPVQPLPVFSSALIYLPDDKDSGSSKRRNVLYMTHQELTLALIGTESHADGLPAKAVELLGRIRSLIAEESRKETEGPVLSSATNILQPRDKHIISRGSFTNIGQGFASTSEHLYNAQSIQERDSEVSEIFSRGQNPQHWHVARRGLGQDRNGMRIDGDVYMEVSRKETSLTDVDNVLAGIVRRYSE